VKATDRTVATQTVKKTLNVRINVTVRRIGLPIAAVEKQ